MTDVDRLAILRQLTTSGEALKLRERAGLTTGEIAREIGVATSTIYRWETNARRPNSSDAALRYA